MKSYQNTKKGASDPISLLKESKYSAVQPLNVIENLSSKKGGAQKAALRQFNRKEQGRDQKSDYLSYLGDIYKFGEQSVKLSSTRKFDKANFTKTISVASFIVAGAISMAYFIVFKAYHASLVKLD